MMLLLFRITFCIMIVAALTANGQSQNEFTKLTSSAIFTRKPPSGAGDASELRKMQIARFLTAQDVFKMQNRVFEVGAWGTNDTDPALPMGQKLVDSYLDLSPTKEERLVILTEYVELLKEFERRVKMRIEYVTVEYRNMQKAHYLVAKSNRLDAEIQLLQAKAAK